VTYLPALSVSVSSPSAGNGLALRDEALGVPPAGPAEVDSDVEGLDAPALGVPPEEELPQPANTTAATTPAAHTVSRRFDGIRSPLRTIEPRCLRDLVRVHLVPNPTDWTVTIARTMSAAELHVLSLSV
jgi:hypothetical protein